MNTPFEIMILPDIEKNGYFFFSEKYPYTNFSHTFRVLQPNSCLHQRFELSQRAFNRRLEVSAAPLITVFFQSLGTALAKHDFMEIDDMKEGKL